MPPLFLSTAPAPQPFPRIESPVFHRRAAALGIANVNTALMGREFPSFTGLGCDQHLIHSPPKRGAIAVIHRAGGAQAFQPPRDAAAPSKPSTMPGCCAMGTCPSAMAGVGEASASTASSSARPAPVAVWTSRSRRVEDKRMALLVDKWTGRDGPAGNSINTPGPVSRCGCATAWIRGAAYVARREALLWDIDRSNSPCGIAGIVDYGKRVRYLKRSYGCLIRASRHMAKSRGTRPRLQGEPHISK